MSINPHVSEAQREVLVAALLAQTHAVAMTGGTIDFFGLLDAPRFIEQTLKESRAADVFCSAFSMQGEHITQQLVCPPEQMHLEVLDLSGSVTAAQDATHFVQRILDAGLDPFTQTPPVRQYLIKIAPAHFRYALVFHHALMDGWGFQRHVAAMARAYRGEAIAFPSYLKHLQSLQDSPADPDLQTRDLAYWQARVPQGPQRLFPDIARPGLAANKLRHVISVAQLQAWKNCAESMNVSLAVLTSAALLTSLHQLTGVAQPVVGIPIHNRANATQKQTLGLFAGLTPLTHCFLPGQNLAAVVAQLKATQRADFRHAGLSRADFVKAWPMVAQGSEPFPLTFSFEPQNYDVDFEGLQFDITAFTPSVISRPAQLYLREYREGQPALLECLQHPGCDSSACSAQLIETMIALLDAQAQPQAAATVPRGPTAEMGGLFQRFEAQVRQRPDACALTDANGLSLSYRELHAQALKAAQALRARGIGPEDFVGLCAGRYAGLVVGLLAILAAGAVYVPLDPAYPSQRLDYLVQDSGVRLVLADELGASALAGRPGVAVLRICELMADVDKDQALDTAHPALSSQAAYVIYTSGSTGKPKGCVVTHRNVLALMDSVLDHGYGPHDRWTMFHSFAFDFSVWEIWGALLFGGQLFLVDQSTTRDPEAFVQLLSSRRITVLSQTPTAFRSLTTVMQMLAEEGQVPSLALRRVIFGGEAFNPSVLQPWFQWCGESVVFTNMYGITETTVHVTQRNFSHQETGKGSLIGPALPGWRLYLLDERFKPVHPGETGEIYVAGLGVTRGYHERASMTAQRMLPDPFSEAGARMYRSGDLARLRHDGEVEYLGRADHQVKIRGFRIEPGEVEDALRACDGVRDAVVAARQDPGSGEDRLIAWLVPHPGAQIPDAQALRQRLEEHLPAHFVPSRLVALAALPLTGNGKLDQAALPDPFGAHSAAPLTATAVPGAKPSATGGIQSGIQADAMAAAQAAWAEVLQATALAPTSNFFALGGDSVVALRILASLREGGFKANLVDLYRYPQLAKFAACITRVAAQTSVAPAATSRYPMLALQAGMIYHGELDPRSSMFLDVFDFDLHVPWDEAALVASLDKLVRWAAPLRTRLDMGHADGAMLVVQENAHLPLKVHDMRGASLTDQRLMTVLWSLTERTQPFDLMAAPLMRVTAHVLADDRFRLTLTFHHAILDGWSFASLFSRWLADWRGHSDLNALPDLSHVQQLASQREQLALQDENLLHFWAEHLRGATPQRAAPQPDELLPVQTKHVEPWDRALAQSLRQLALDQGLALRSILLGVQFLAQALLTGQTDVVTGYVTHCRPEVDGAQEAPGLFLNTLPLRMPVPASTNLRDWLALLAQQETNVLEHRWLPLPAIRKLAPGWPLFQVGFNFVHFHVYNEQLGSDTALIGSVEVYERTDFPLLVQFSVDPRSQDILLTLVPQHTDHAHTEADLQHLGEVMRHMAQACISAMNSMNGTVDLAVLFASVRSTVPAQRLANAARLLQPDWSEESLGTPLLARGPSPEKATDATGPFVGSADTCQRILRIWNDVLCSTGQDLDLAFVTAGGDSIAATRLMAQVRREFATDLPLRLFMEFPTVRGLAAALERHTHTSNGLAQAEAKAHTASNAPIARSLRRSQHQETHSSSKTEPHGGNQST
jgi:amino acid adenylation domain-containing protein